MAVKTLSKKAVCTMMAALVIFLNIIILLSACDNPEIPYTYEFPYAYNYVLEIQFDNHDDILLYKNKLYGLSIKTAVEEIGDKTARFEFSAQQKLPSALFELFAENGSQYYIGYYKDTVQFAEGTPLFRPGEVLEKSIDKNDNLCLTVKEDACGRVHLNDSFAAIVINEVKYTFAIDFSEKADEMLLTTMSVEGPEELRAVKPEYYAYNCLFDQAYYGKIKITKLSCEIGGKYIYSL